MVNFGLHEINSPPYERKQFVLQEFSNVKCEFRFRQVLVKLFRIVDFNKFWFEILGMYIYISCGPTIWNCRLKTFSVKIIWNEDGDKLQSIWNCTFKQVSV